MWGNPLTDNTGWFKVDLIGGIPFELIAGGLVAKKDRKSIKILKWLKLPKLLRAGRLQKLMGKYVSFAMFLKHIAMALVFLHVFACAYLGHYGFEAYGVDEDGNDIIYAKDVNGHSYYVDKVCNIRNLYKFVDGYQGDPPDSSYSSYGDDSAYGDSSSYSSSYSAYGRRLAGDDAPNYHDFNAPVDYDCLSLWDAYVEAVCSIMGMIVGGTATVLGIPDHEMGSYNTPRGDCYPRAASADWRATDYGSSSYGDSAYGDSSSYSSYAAYAAYAAASYASRRLGGSYYGASYFTDEKDYVLDEDGNVHGFRSDEGNCEEGGFSVTGAGLRIMCIPLGTLIYWLMQADIVVVMFNSTNAYSRQQAGLTRARAEVEYFGFDDELANKVNASLDYRWKGHIPSECSLIQDKAIGAIIQKEVVLHFHGAQICDEILFSGCPSNCIAMAAFALRTNIVPNYTYIYRKGELGLECYLLSKGDALQLDDDNTVVNELPCSDMFGEMAVITHQETHYREEDIFALTYCELETLTLQDFDKICKAFPVLESNAKILMEIMRRDHDNHRDQWDRYRDQLKGEFEKVQSVSQLPRPRPRPFSNLISTF